MRHALDQVPVLLPFGLQDFVVHRLPVTAAHLASLRRVHAPGRLVFFVFRGVHRRLQVLQRERVFGDPFFELASSLLRQEIGQLEVFPPFFGR